MPKSSGSPASDSLARSADHLEEMALRLAEKLRAKMGQGFDLSGRDACLVFAIPRAGVPLARALADRLGCDLEVLLVHGFSSARHPEVELGLATEDGEIFLTRGSHHLGFTEREVEEAAIEAIQRLQETRRIYSPDNLEPRRGKDRIAILADDGTASLGALVAAVRFLKTQAAREIVVVSPLLPGRTYKALEHENVELVTLSLTESDEAIRHLHSQTVQITDARILHALKRGINEHDLLGDEEEVQIECGRVLLQGVLLNAKTAKGLVVCAHGTGAGRFERKNQRLASELRKRGIATFLVDLLDDEETRDARNFADSPLLGHRLSLVIEWISKNPSLSDRPIGLFGAGVAGAAALQTGAEYPLIVKSLVCRCGRTDLAHAYLSRVRAPTLLLVPDDDEEAVKRNRAAIDLLSAQSRLEILEHESWMSGEVDPVGAESGLVAERAAVWFADWLKPAPASLRTNEVETRL